MPIPRPQSFREARGTLLLPGLSDRASHSRSLHAGMGPGGKVQLLGSHSIFQEALQRSQAFPCHPDPAKPLRDTGESRGLFGFSAGNAPESGECPGESCRVRPCGEGMPGHAGSLSVNSIGASDLVLQHSRK